MAGRIREYTGVLLDRLICNGVMAREGGLPQRPGRGGTRRRGALDADRRGVHLARMRSELAVRDLALLRPAVLSTYIDIGGVEYDWPKYNLVAATVWLQSSTTPRREESLVLPM